MFEDKSTLFAALGVELVDGPGDNKIGDCPFCGKPEHLYVDLKTGQWDCKRCGEEGNVFNFLSKYADILHQETTEVQWQELAKSRGIPAEAFKEAKMGKLGPYWIIPVKGDTGFVRDYRRWNQSFLKTLPGGATQLWGIHELVKAQRGSVVWVCEGEWDGIALRWLLRRCNFRKHIVVAVPGAGTFKDQWVKHFQGHEVRWMYDNDDPGEKGCKKASEKLRGVAAAQKFCIWPSIYKSGYDVRDFISEGIKHKAPLNDILKNLRKLLYPVHKDDRAAFLEKTQAPAGKEIIPRFEDVLDTFRRWIKMDEDMEIALAITLATCLSNDLPGDPIFMYLVGPPGSGKTLVLMCTQTSDRTVFKSTLTPASLVSGFNTHPDPSLLPKLDGKTAVFKDGTELLALNPEKRKEIYGTLRGAFDGHVYKPFGNGITREYKLHFNMLIGVTPAIHGDNQAMMGERFLKFEMKENPDNVREKIRAAISNLTISQEIEEALSDVGRRFLLQKVDIAKLPTIPDIYIDRIIAISQILSLLRAQVDREQYGEREIKYRPTHEVGTRVAKQLAKLATMLCVVYRLQAMDERVWRVIERVAYDTAIGFHVDVVTTIVRAIGDTAWTKDEISQVIKLPGTTTGRILADLEQLNIIDRFKPSVNGKANGHRGPIPFRYKVTPLMLKLWQEAEGWKVKKARSQ